MTNHDVGNVIGVITQIVDNKTLCFLTNNQVECNIGDIVGIESDVSKGEYVIAKILTINVEYYLDNARQYFVSRAVENNVEKLAENNSRPRYGQSVIAKILGHYKLIDKHFCEIKSRIDQHTPNIFQRVFAVEFNRAVEIYGLYRSENNPAELQLGTLVYPHENDVVTVFFNSNSFRRHTLITGVTGSGKSRLASLIVSQLTQIGAHISILDPHDEYIDLLSQRIQHIHRYSTDVEVTNYKNVKHNLLTFSERYINASVLTKLLPSISEPQKIVIHDIFDKYQFKGFSTKTFIDKLTEELNDELLKEHTHFSENIRKAHMDSDAYSRGNHSRYIERYINEIRKINRGQRVTKVDVILAVIDKINALRSSGIIVSDEQNWLIASPNSVDIFSIDYSTNEYITRFVDAIIQFLLRKKSSDSFRALVVDEAHMLLVKDSQTSKLVKQLLREARKFNISVIFISQNIQDIPEEIRGQFQNQFCFRETKVDETKYFPDQVCYVSMFGSKSNFAMRVADTGT